MFVPEGIESSLKLSADSVVVAGLTPAWQQIQVYQNLIPGAVNRATRALACASGKVLNVSMAIESLCEEGSPLNHACVCMIGGSTGNLIEQELAGRSIKTHWIYSKVPTRVCTTLLDQDKGQTTELVENAAAVESSALVKFAEVFHEAAGEADWAVLTGSLPADTPADYYRRLMKGLPGNCRVILDVRGDELLKCLELHPFLVKPNREELEKTVNRPLAGDTDIVEAMRALQNAGARHVLVSNGISELLLLTETGRVFSYCPLQSANVNPIGCGDCLTGGLVYALAKNMDLDKAVKVGIAAAADNASALLPARLNRNRVLSAAEQVKMTECQ